MGLGTLTRMRMMHRMRTQPSNETPVRPMMRVTVLVVPMTPSPMMIRPRRPRRSAMWVALKESWVQTDEMPMVPMSSIRMTAYKAPMSPATAVCVFGKPAYSPPNTAAAAEKSSVLSESGRVSLRRRFPPLKQMTVVTRYWRARMNRLEKRAQHSIRYT